MNLSDREHQRAVFERADIGVLESDCEGTVTYANPQAMELVGVTRYDGLPLSALYEDPMLLDEQLRKRRAGLIGNYRARLIRQSDGTTLPVKVTAVPLTDAEGLVVGTFALFRHPLEEEINRIHQEVDDPDSVLFRVMQELRKVIPFDLVTATRYSSDLRHSQPFFAYLHGPGGDKVTWRKKQWDAVPPAFAGEVADTRTVLFGDLQQRLAHPAVGALRDTPLVQMLLRERLQTCIRRPIRRNRRLCASVTFYSRSPDGLTEEHRARIDELPIAASVIQAIEYFDRRREADQYKLLREVAFCPTVEAVYVTLLRRLCEMFAWQRAAMYRVDHAASRIKLVAVFIAPHTTLTKGLRYEQAIDQGILGRVVRTKQPQMVPDITADPDYLADDQEEADKTLPGVPGSRLPPPAVRMQSELCLPLGLEGDGKVRWIIDVEDPRADAFSAEELTWLGETARHAGGFMQRLSQLNFLSECLDHTSEPIVVVDAHGSMKRANPAAAELFGVASDKDLAGPIAALFATPADADRALAAPDGYLGEYEVRGPLGRTVAAGVSRKPLPEDIGGAIYVFKDMRPIRRGLELELLERTAYEIALETRTPLMFVVSELERVVRKDTPVSPASAELLLKYLYRTQHAYTKLAMYNQAVRATDGGRQVMDLAAEVRAIHRWLPAEMRSLVRPLTGDEPARCEADCFQLTFVLETLLMFFVRTAPEDVPVIVTVQRIPGHVVVGYEGVLSGADSAGEPAAAQGELRLAYPLIVDYVARNGGSYRHAWVQDDRALHTLSFPEV